MFKASKKVWVVLLLISSVLNVIFIVLWLMKKRKREVNPVEQPPRPVRNQSTWTAASTVVWETIFGICNQILSFLSTTQAPQPPSWSRRMRIFPYDVFLSFRGKDTRKTFTGHLYVALNEKGIRTFIDDSLEKGEKIQDLLGYIGQSQIFMPIFSLGFAESQWCLMEVAKAVEIGRLIIPVFYDVEPSVVKNQSGSFEAAFRKHAGRLSAETVKGWRDALRRVGELSGYVLETETNGHEAKLIGVIIARIFEEQSKNLANARLSV